MIGPPMIGPPMIGVLRVPWSAVEERILDRLHGSGFADFDASYLSVFSIQALNPDDLRSKHIAKGRPLLPSEENRLDRSRLSTLTASMVLVIVASLEHVHA